MSNCDVIIDDVRKTRGTKFVISCQKIYNMKELD